jgi:hypothetical protein
MPFYDQTGIKLYKDDACSKCDLVHACNVITDLNMNQSESQYAGIHIVPKGEEADREDYVGCQSYRPWINPNDKPDLDPQFGRRLSQQEKDMLSNPKAPLPERF